MEKFLNDLAGLKDVKVATVGDAVHRELKIEWVPVTAANRVEAVASGRVDHHCRSESRQRNGKPLRIAVERRRSVAMSCAEGAGALNASPGNDELNPRVPDKCAAEQSAEDPVAAKDKHTLTQSGAP